MYCEEGIISYFFSKYRKGIISKEGLMNNN